MRTTAKTLYDTDFVEWTAHTARLLREGRLGEVDAKNLAEEIEDLGKNDQHMVESLLLRILFHQIKRRIQPERETSSWRRSILFSQPKLRRKLQDSPSLRRFLLDELDGIYQEAVRGALLETGIKSAELPEHCPFGLDEVIDSFDLNWL